MNDPGSASKSSREILARWALPVATLLFFALTAPGYGVFRDELYYFACGQHLAWGYVDQPPLIALIAAVCRALFGTSWIAARVVVAVAAGATVLLVGDTAKELGAGRWGRVLAQVLIASAPIFLGLFSFFSMNAFNLLIWAGLARLASRLLAGGNPRLWLAFGALAGVGLENKFDVGLVGAGLALGLILGRRFDVLRQRWLWLGGALAALLFLPHVLWQWQHGWPTREFIANAQEGKIHALGALGFLVAQLKTVGPVASLLALGGLVWLLLARAARPFRPMGWAIVTVLAIFAFSISKPYYFAAAFTWLFPAAGAAVEGWTAGIRWQRGVRVATMVLAATILLAAPLAKPLLPVETYLRYSAALGEKPGSSENHELGRLPQFFADMHGWRQMAEAVAQVYDSLPPEDRAQACVYTQNYGEAGAIDFFGPELGLPPATSGHNNYWYWGLRGCSGQVLLIFGGNPENHQRVYADLTPGGTFECTDCMPYENHRTIWIARHPKIDLASGWERVRHFD
ncbi:MAG: glycosyltransferase family 39 protein [Acidobacteria bacterium]|nr:glycosyltransferase family 39 protein [Acidobacteriota bacterium]